MTKPTMRVTDAIRLIVERNGGPLDDDWDLCEAATVLAAYVSKTCVDEVGFAGKEAFNKLGVETDDICIAM